MGDEPLGGVELALYEHFRHLDCGQVVDPADPEDSANMAVEIARFMRAAGWVPLADVLDALRDEDAMERFAERHGDDLDGWYVEPVHRERLVIYLAERFAPTAPEGADERNGHDR